MNSNRLEIKLSDQLTIKNPVIPSAGCIGFGIEFQNLYDLSLLGAVTLKATSLEPRVGNAGVRIVECASGALNSVGLQNDGVDSVIEKIKSLSSINVPVIVNIAGNTIHDYVQLAKRFSHLSNVKIIELNISCPNVTCNKLVDGDISSLPIQITRALKEVTNKLVFVKLGPSFSNIVDIAKGIEHAGADGISMINSIPSIALDYDTGKPVFSNISGGLSGPAIKPIALKMVYEVSQSVNIPIIGIGGVNSARDVIDYISAGATAVGVGLSNLVDPLICPKIIKDLDKELDNLGVENISDLRGRS